MNEFRKIIGQHKAIAHLQSALRRNEPSHAYILNGEPGSGRMELAQTFGAALLCQNPVEREGLIEPCGTCPACIRTAAGSHADLQIYTQDRLSQSDRTKNRVGIRLIRLLIADVQIKPYEGGRKVYIIPDAEQLTVEAQNALLKTLEEPPAYAVLILLANGTTNLLPTILSRCVTLRMEPLGRQELTAYLTDECGVPQTTAALAAGLSQGNPGMAREMVENEDYQSLYTSSMDLYEHLAERSAYDLASFAQGVAQTDAAMAFLDITQCWIRDLMVCKSTRSADGLILCDRIPYIRNIAQQLSFETIEALQQELLQAQERRRIGGRPEQYLEVMLLNMRSKMQ